MALNSKLNDLLSKENNMNTLFTKQNTFIFILLAILVAMFYGLFLICDWMGAGISSFLTGLGIPTVLILTVSYISTAIQCYVSAVVPKDDLLRKTSIASAALMMFMSVINTNVAIAIMPFIILLPLTLKHYDKFENSIVNK